MRKPLISIVIVCLSISLQGTAPWLSARNAPERGQSQGDEHRADPCDLLPDANGKARGFDELCPPEGSSGGVARGDFNGDGFADLAVGVPFEDLSATKRDAGAVHVIYGSANGLTAGGGSSGIPAAQFWHQDVSDTVLGGVQGVAETNDHFGAALAAGEFNGDGFSDLAIGVPGEDSGDYTGGVHILFGTANGLTAAAAQIDDQLWTYNNAAFLHDIPPADTKFGEALVWGDFDGDSVGDLAIGMPGAAGACHILGCTSEAGRVVILFGSSPGGLSTAGHQIVVQDTFLLPPANVVQIGDANEEGDRFGSVLAAGDIDADSFADLVIGVPKEDFEASILGPFVIDHGVIHVAFGSNSGVTSRDRFPLSRCGDRCQFGRALAIGDFNGDGFADVAGGAPFDDVGGQTNAGRVYVINGSANGLDAITSWDQDTFGIQGGAETSDHFGKALAAGDFNGDSRADLAIGVPDENLLDANGNNQPDAGGVHIIYGSSTGLTEVGDQFFDQDDLGPGRSVEAGDQFGASLTAWNFGRNETVFGLVRRTADLAIGVPGEDLLGDNQISNAGAVSVLYGHFLFPQGLQPTGNQFWHQNLVAGGTGDPSLNEAGDLVEAEDQFGSALY